MNENSDSPMKSIQTITFDDGYTVTINDRGSVSWDARGKPANGSGTHASHFKPVPETGRAADFIRKQGKAPADYLWACPGNLGQGYILRAGNGVREALAAAVLRSNAQSESEKANRDRKAAEREAQLAPLVAAMQAQEREILAAIPADCIQLSVSEHSDGDGGTYYTYSHDGIQIRFEGIKHAWVSATEPGAQAPFMFRCIAWLARAEADRQVAAHQAAAETANAKNRQRAAARAAKFDEAKTTGQPVALAHWTTDRCMNHHDSECSFDNATEWALPDGKTRTTYTCCY